MKQEVCIIDGIVHLTIGGSIYAEEADMLKESLWQYMEKGYSRFSLKFDHVDYIDSAGLGVLVAAQKKALYFSGEIVICGLGGAMKELFELSRLNMVFKVE